MKWSVLLALTAAVSFASAAAVARPLQGPGVTCPLPPAAKLTAEKNPVSTSTPVVVYGSGWDPGTTVNLAVNGSSYFQAPYHPKADAKGNFTITFTADRSPGRMLVSTLCDTASVKLWIMVVSLPRLLPCEGDPVVRPKSYVLACADRSVALKAIAWKTWDPTSATGSATYVAKAKTYRASIMLDKVKGTPRGVLFTKLTIRYSVGGARKVVTRPLPTS